MKAIERLFLFFEHNGIKHTSLEKELGFSNGYFNNSLKKGGSIGDQSIEKIIAKFPDLNLQWLITGNGEMMSGLVSGLVSGLPLSQNETIQEKGDKKNYNISEELNNKNLLEDSIRFQTTKNKVYLMEEAVEVTAGLLVGFTQENVHNLEPINIPWLGSGIFYVFKVRGDSMYNTLSNGDRVYAKLIQDRNYLKTGEIYVVISSNGMVIKRLFDVNDNELVFTSDNDTE